MINFNLIDQLNFKDKSKLVELADFCLTPLRIAFNGRVFTLNNQGDALAAEKKISHLAIRVFAGCLGVLLSMITLAALSIKLYHHSSIKIVLIQSGKDEKPTDLRELKSKDAEYPTGENKVRTPSDSVSDNSLTEFKTSIQNNVSENQLSLLPYDMIQSVGDFLTITDKFNLGSVNKEFSFDPNYNNLLWHSYTKLFTPHQTLYNPELTARKNMSQILNKFSQASRRGPTLDRYETMIQIIEVLTKKMIVIHEVGHMDGDHYYICREGGIDEKLFVFPIFL